ncbi:ATP-grasp fold amidoligase family protein [Alkalibacterium putridalgicola]|uniref:ATP-grasp fold amidoligase family protein n=1 Tax=Alkalibacterium putridalgicola TaxID=426703 RepID=UPI0034CE6581
MNSVMTKGHSLVKFTWYKLIKYKLLKKMSDKRFIELDYLINTKNALNLTDPKTFNEKLQWLKLNNRKTYYTTLVDKYEVREYISELIGEEYLIPLLGVYDTYDDIDFRALPDQFVMKPTHTSGNIFICKDKNQIDHEALRGKIDAWLSRDYYSVHREWPYKNVNPRIIIEEYIEQESGSELRDYRFFCFDGAPKFITVDFNIIDKSKTRRNLYDVGWNIMDATISYPQEKELVIEKPEKLEQLIELSCMLSKDIPHARIDFYYINNKIKFGEITFFHQSGMGDIQPDEFNIEMGNWITVV